MQTAHLPRYLVNQILEQAQNSPKEEICGLIASHDGRPIHCYPVKNASRQPAHHFRMEPRQQIDIMRKMREQGEELYAIYHSHPDTPPTPSAEDLEQATYPDALHIIISMGITGTLQMCGFKLRSDIVQAVDIDVE